MTYLLHSLNKIVWRRDGRCVPVALFRLSASALCDVVVALLS